MTTSLENELLEAQRKLENYTASFESMPAKSVLDEIWTRTKEIAKSASGSWLGYQANVYYEGFRPPPAGVHFDIENGTAGTYFAGPNPAWIERTSEEVYSALMTEEDKEALVAAEARADEGLLLLNSVKADIASMLAVYLQGRDDSYVRRLAEETDKEKVVSLVEMINDRSPKRQLVTVDMRAVSQGTWAPPHVKVQSRITAAMQPSAHCTVLAERVGKLAAHISRMEKSSLRSSRVGTNIFIGHGRASAWRDLKDFIQDRLRLPWDEFNRVPVAGITNIARLSEMLDSAACAFVIMTAEDETAEGTMQARMNVIHEVGLFQGRLGFTKAIVLLEEGCQEFSNINGLGQIRFPKGNISAKFEEIRQVLEREGVL